ncbi:MAG: DUF4153 domain-containing protein [Caulobacter sp.]|nr:DUF4153 domain-containing protein [Caulobacter sp.]
MSQDSELETGAGRRLLLTRLLIGLAQGVVLFGLSEAAERKAWPANDRPLFIALVVAALAIGPVLLSGLGGLKRRPLAVWAGAAALLAALVGWVDGYRGLEAQQVTPTPLVAMAVLICLFVAHSLIVAAARDHRRIAAYPTYFDVAWKHGVQLALAAGFTGIFWGVLALGAALFNMIGVKLVGDVIEERWFAIPATALAFAAAVHLTDVRVGLIQGVRTVALTLLGWLLPLLAGLTLAFLLTLPFTGLKPLWDTRNASVILISAGGAVILLINAAYQDGGREKPLPAALRWAMRLAGLLLAPVTVLAAYALWLRVGQYGLTIERIIAIACVVIGACYAVGYGLAAGLPGPVMRRLEPTNVATSFVGLAVLLALLTPIADPVRLSVDNQVARLQAGRVKPAEFDFDYLKFSAGRFGKQALDRLSKGGGEIGRLATAARLRTDRVYETPAADVQPVDGVKVYPAGKAMPEKFRAQWVGLAGWLCRKEAQACEVFLIDLNLDGDDEALLNGGSGTLILFDQYANGNWDRVGELDTGPTCGGREPLADLRAGKFELRPGRYQDIEFGGARRVVKRDRSGCLEAAVDVAAPAPVKQRRQAGGKAQ